MTKPTFVTAINKVHQAKVNRACAWLSKYNSLNDLRNIADSDGDEKAYSKLDRQCANAFDKYLDIVDELPSREKNNIEKSELY